LYFGANERYLLKKKIADNAKWMARQIGVVPLDLEEIEQTAAAFNLETLSSPYFTSDGVAAVERLRNRFVRGSRYRDAAETVRTKVWGMKPRERVQTLMDLLSVSQQGKTYRAQDDAHFGFVLEAAMQLGIGVGLLMSNLRGSDVGQLEQRVREELYGGRESLRQREAVVEVLSHIEGAGDEGPLTLDLPSFPRLLDLVARTFARRLPLLGAVRALDVARHHHAVGHVQASTAAPGGPLARKFAVDLVQLFCTANGVDQDFVARTSDLMSGEPREDHHAGRELTEDESVGPEAQLLLGMDSPGDGAGRD